MDVWLRLLTVWLVALALPAQGLASATMAHCGPSHARMNATQSHNAHHHGVDTSTSTHSHAVQSADATDHASTAAQVAHQPGELSDLGKYKCSSCASCCSGSALPSTMPIVPEPEFAPTIFAAEVTTVGVFATDGPDRPPRIHRA